MSRFQKFLLNNFNLNRFYQIHQQNCLFRFLFEPLHSLKFPDSFLFSRTLFRGPLLILNRRGGNTFGTFLYPIIEKEKKLHFCVFCFHFILFCAVAHAPSSDSEENLLSVVVFKFPIYGTFISASCAINLLVLYYLCFVV